MPSSASASLSDSRPASAVHPGPLPDSMPPSCPRDSDNQHIQGVDVTMAESTITIGNTMCLDYLAGGGVTPPPFAGSVPFPVDVAKVI